MSPADMGSMPHCDFQNSLVKTSSFTFSRKSTAAFESLETCHPVSCLCAKSAGQAFPCRRALVSAQARQGTPRTSEGLRAQGRGVSVRLCLKRLSSQQLSVGNSTVIGLAGGRLVCGCKPRTNSPAFSSSRGTPIRVSRFSCSCCLGQVGKANGRGRCRWGD